MSAITTPPALPTPFKKGSTFSFALNVPTTVAAGYFRGWEVQAQIRRKGDSSPRGLISTLGSKWENNEQTRRLFVFSGLTDEWPVGPAEMDIMFINGSGYKLRAKTVQIDIQRGITR